MTFDLGTEVLIKPILWALLSVTTLSLLISSFKRIKIEVEGEEGFELTKWKVNGSRLRRAGIIGLIGGLFLTAFVVVPPGHRGVLYTSSGVSTVERAEGYSFIAPVIHNVALVSVREQAYTNDSVFAQTADLLEVTLQLGVNYRVDASEASEVYRDLGADYEGTVVERAVLDIAKEATGQIEALDLAQEREKLAQAILSGLRARLEPLGIVPTFVAVEDAIFDKGFVSAVLAKEIADEKAAESKRLVEVATNEAQQAIERATGTATAIAIEAQAKREEQELLGMSATEYVWFKTWDGVLPATLLGDGGEFIVTLP